MRVTAVESQHFSGRGLRRDGTLWASWVLAGEAGRVFFSGDTGYFDGYAGIGAEHGPFDVSLMAVGAYDPAWADIHLDPEEAVRATAELGGGLLLPIHWCTFVLAPHPWAEPVERMLVAAATEGVPVVVPRVGDRVDVSAPAPPRPVVGGRRRGRHPLSGPLRPRRATMWTGHGGGRRRVGPSTRDVP